VIGAAWGLLLGPLLPRLPVATVAGGVLLALLLVCTVTDLLWHKIYNWATYTAFLWAVILNVAADLILAGSSGFDGAGLFRDRLGAVGAAEQFAGGNSVLVALLVVYRMSGARGAGDVKLAAALGSWLGLTHGLAAVLFTYAIAGAVLGAWLVVIAGPLRVGQYGLRLAGSWLLPTLVMPPSDLALPMLNRPVPMAAFFAAGTLIVLFEVSVAVIYRKQRASRRGLSSLEAVMVTAIGVPAAAFLVHIGIQACRGFYRIVASLVDWPYL